MFSITQGKGFRIKFKNGWALSVQWGVFNYCANHDNSSKAFADFRTPMRPIDVNVDCANAEIAIINPAGDLVPFPDVAHDEYADTVRGYQTPKDVLFWMNAVAAMPSALTTHQPVPPSNDCAA